MKKILAVLFAVMLVVLCSCGNQRLLDFEHDTYNYIHCFETGKCYKITSWKNNEIGIKVVTEKYGNMYFSEGTYLLIENDCPVCGTH